METTSKSKEELCAEYYRSALFGTGKNKKRRSCEEIAGELKGTCGEEFQSVLDALNEKVEKTKTLAEKAVEIAKAGIKADSLELENLLLEATSIGDDAASQYVRNAFKNTPTTEPPGEKNTKKKSNVLSGEDFFTGDTFKPDLPKPDGSFPDNWFKCFPNQPTEDFGQLMYKYCIFGLWDEGESRDDKMNNVVAELHRLFSDEERIENALQVAQAWLERAVPVLKSAIKRENDTPEQVKTINTIGGPLPDSIRIKRKKEQDNKIKNENAKTHEPKIMLKNPAPGQNDQNYSQVPPMAHNARSFAFKPSHPNEIFGLKPADEWNLYIDESGDDESFTTNGRGVIAGALSCASNPLPPQPQLHASTDATDELMTAGDKVIETLLNHGQCGVLAVPVSAYSSALGWGSLIASFIDLVLRLLPLSPGKTKTKLNVFVEGRAPYNQDVDFNFMRDACRYNLMHVFPERANKIDFTIQAMDKTNAHNAYPDLIANTCAIGMYGNNLAGKRLSASNWKGTCFLNYPATNLRNLLEYYFGGRNLPPAEWDALLTANTSSNIGLLAAILEAIGTEAQENLALWKTYLDWTVSHLSSKAINMRRLHAQLDWLKRYQPVETELPPRIKLLWLTSKLAEANHLGEIESQSPVGQEFMRLVEELYEEDAPLVCWAVLHLAVQKTNAYQFEEAKKLISDFCDIGSLLSKEPPFSRFAKIVFKKPTGEKEPQNYVPAAIPGLRYYGQLLSTCGQHEAFLGNNKKAITFFKEAIKCFERLSEKKALDIDQTSAYLATAQMDLAPTSQETQAVMEQYLGLPLVDAAKKLAESNEDLDKYHHHILLRYLVQSQSKKAIQAYLGAKAKWKVGEGHPWEMIEFYRALLLENEKERWNHLGSAYDIAQKEGGATLRVIACVILTAATYFNKNFSVEKLQKCINEAVTAVPALGKTRVKALQNQLVAPIPPLELAKIVLPFNFR